jgi:hypothetical protein
MEKLIWKIDEISQNEDCNSITIETLIKKEIKDFLNSNTLRQFEDKMLDMVAKDLKRGKLESETKEIVIKIFKEFYQLMWTQRSMWEPRLRSA